MKVSWIVAGVLVLVLVLAGCQREGDEVVNPVSEPLLTDTTIDPQGEVESGAGIPVVLQDGSIGLESDQIPAGPIVFAVSNSGTEVHSFAIEGEDLEVRLQENLSPGGSATMEAVLSEGSYRAWCPLHEEEESGERIEFQAEGSDAPAPAGTAQTQR